MTAEPIKQRKPRRKETKPRKRRVYLKSIDQLNAELVLIETKGCSRCGHTLPIDRFRVFTKNTGRKYFKSWCIQCNYEYDLQDRKRKMAESPEAYIKRYQQSHMKTRYGITLEIRAQMAVDQNHLCAICQKPKKLTVDHCHGSKVVRGLLCGDCNRGIGLFHDDTGVMDSAIKYLTNAKIRSPQNISPPTLLPVS